MANGFTIDQSWVLGGEYVNIDGAPVGSELVFLIGAIHRSSFDILKIYVEICEAVNISIMFCMYVIFVLQSCQSSEGWANIFHAGGIFQHVDSQNNHVCLQN